MLGRPIHSVIVSGETEALPDLLQLGYNVNELDEDGHPPILVAAVYGCWDAVLLLLSDSNIKVDDVFLKPRGNNLLHIAAQNTDQSKFYSLLIHPKTKGTQELLLNADSAGCAAFPNSDRDTPLHFFCQRFSEDTEGILDLFAKVEQAGIPYLTLQKSPTALSYPNKQGVTPLHITCAMADKTKLSEKMIGK